VNRLWQVVTGIAATAMGVMALLLKASLKRTKRAEQEAAKQARLAAAKREQLKARVRAELASTKAAEEGDRHVEQVREEARAGRRDHFVGGMFDD